MIRYLLLGLLRDGTPRHGYALAKEYRRGCCVRLSLGNVYRELQRLVAAGLTRTAASPPGSDPRRASYQITEAGCRAFDAWIAAPALWVASEPRDELSLRAYLIARTGSAQAPEVLDHWQEELLHRRRLFEREAAVAPAGADGNGVAVMRLLRARRLRHVAVDLEFVEALRSEYRAWESARPRGGPAQAAAAGRLPTRRRATLSASP
jgi:DNA-binding PadR family transcriptional regulator